MKETISNNKKSLFILNKLVQNGFYKGTVAPNKFELERNVPSFVSAKNHQIIGTLNNDNKFEIDFKLKFPMDMLSKILFSLGVMFSIFWLIKRLWFLTIPFFIVPFLSITIYNKLKRKKEIKLFTSRFLELYKLEHEE